MKASLTCLLSAILLLGAAAVRAGQGKVFFQNGRWLKGDIQIQTDDDGKQVVVIGMRQGSVTVPRSEVKSVVFNSKASPSDDRFQRALQNTRQALPAPHVSSLYEPYIREASVKHHLDPDLVKAVIKQESDFNRKDVSNKGAQGLMQLMPDTARKLGVEDSFDPWENIHGGVRYLKMMIENFNGDLPKALAAYNAGPHAVEKYGAIPPYRETQDYVRSVLRYYQVYRGSKLYAFQDRKGRLVFTDRPILP